MIPTIGIEEQSVKLTHLTASMRDLKMGKDGTSLFLSAAQYWEAKAPARAISPSADTKQVSQKKANKL